MYIEHLFCIYYITVLYSDNRNLLQIYQNDISSCLTPNSFVMVNYKTFHLTHHLVFVKFCPPTGQITRSAIFCGPKTVTFAKSAHL